MKSITKTLHSFKYAFEGVKHAIHNHQNMKIHLVASVIALILSLVLGISGVEFLLVIFAIMFVIFAEMVNTAIEEMTDLITTEHRQQAKVAKDIAAASVLIASLFAIIVAVVIFLPPILSFFMSS